MQETTQILWYWNGSKCFCSERCISTSPRLEQATSGVTKMSVLVFWGSVLLNSPVLGPWAAVPVHRVALWISGPGEIGFKNPLPPEVGFSLSARCPGIMDSTWQQFSWKTTGAYACDYTYVCAHMHACTDIFTVLCLHIQRYLFIWKSKPTSVF